MLARAWEAMSSTTPSRRACKRCSDKISTPSRCCSPTTSRSRRQAGSPSRRDKPTWLAGLAEHQLDEFELRLLATRQYDNVAVVLAESAQKGRPRASHGSTPSATQTCGDAETRGGSFSRSSRVDRPPPRNHARGAGCAWELEQLGDQLRRTRGAVRLDRPVVDLAPDLLGDRGGDLGGAVGLEVHAAPGAVALAAGGARGSSARSGGGAGSRGTAAGSRSAPSRSSARPGRPRGRRRRGGGRGRGRRRAPRGRRAAGRLAGSMRGPATTIMRRSGTRSFASGNASITRRSRWRADARAADGDDADALVVAVAERARGRRARAGRSR